MHCIDPDGGTHVMNRSYRDGLGRLRRGRVLRQQDARHIRVSLNVSDNKPHAIPSPLPKLFDGDIASIGGIIKP